MDVADLVRRHAVSNTIVCTFADGAALEFAANWVSHLHKAGVGGLLVGLVRMRPDTRQYQQTMRRLQQHSPSVAVYPVLSKVHLQFPQGGRWFSVLPLLETGARVILSDCDVVWLRNPLPYLLRLERAHPLMDFAVSTDAQGPTDRLRLRSRSHGHGDDGDFDIEAFSSCHASMNIGLISFAPGARAGARRAISEAVAHLRAPGALRRVDQGPINYRWKHGAAGWRWPRELHRVGDHSGARLCGLINGTAVAGILPIIQFGNMLTEGVLNLSSKAAARPVAVHATWMRSQRAEYKIARLREAGLWAVDEPPYFSGSPGRLGLLTYTPRIPADMMAEAPTLLRVKGGGTSLPAHHLRFMAWQLSQLRDALFIARLLGRALVLPHVQCSCELGFYPRHVGTDCRAHKVLRLPYQCPIDHYLNPVAMRTSPYLLRERSFLDNPRTPIEVKEGSSVLVVRMCRNGSTGCLSGVERGAIEGVDAPRGARLTTLSGSARANEIKKRFGSNQIRRLHFDDIRHVFGGFESVDQPLAARYYKDAQELLSSWCCTSDERFKQLAGLVPYIFSPPKGVRWRPELRWVADALQDFLPTHATGHAYQDQVDRARRDTAIDVS